MSNRKQPVNKTSAVTAARPQANNGSTHASLDSSAVPDWTTETELAVFIMQQRPEHKS